MDNEVILKEFTQKLDDIYTNNITISVKLINAVQNASIEESDKNFITHCLQVDLEESRSKQKFELLMVTLDEDLDYTNPDLFDVRINYDAQTVSFDVIICIGGYKHYVPQRGLAYLFPLHFGMTSVVIYNATEIIGRARVFSLIDGRKN